MLLFILCVYLMVGDLPDLVQLRQGVDSIVYYIYIYIYYIYIYIWLVAGSVPSNSPGIWLRTYIYIYIYII